MKRTVLILGLFGIAAAVRVAGQDKIAKAQQLLAEGKPREVVSLLQGVLMTDIQYRETLRLLANAFLLEGQLDSAESHGKELLAFNDKNIDAIVPVVRALAGQKKFSEAYAIMKKGLKANKENAVLLVELGKLHLAADSLDQSEVAFSRAKNADPKILDAYIGLGAVYEKRGAIAIAIYNYEEATKIDSSRIDLKHTLAQWYQKEQRYNDAARMYFDVIKNSVDKVKPSLELGTLYYKAKQFGNAARVLANYVAAHPEDKDTWKLFAESVEAGKAYDVGLMIADSVLLKEPQNPRALKLAGKCATLVGRTARSQEKHEKAAAHFKNLQKLQPLDTEDLKYYGKAHFELKNDSLAIDLLEKSLVLDSAQTDIYMDLGFAYMRKKNWSNAAGQFNKKVQADSTGPPTVQTATALINYALCMEQLQDWAKSRKALVQALQVVPNNILGHLNLAITYRQMGADSLPQAKREYETVIALIDTNKSKYKDQLGDSYKQIAFINLVNKNWAAAEEAIAKSLEFRSRDVELMLWHAQTLHALGRRDDARREYERIVKVAPKSKEAEDAKKGVDRLDLGF